MFHVWVQHKAGRRNLCLEWIEPDTGKRRNVSAGTSDRGEAEKKAAALAVKLEHRLQENTSTMRWERFVELYRDEHLCGLRPRSQEKADMVLKLFEEECQPTRLKKVNERLVAAFVNKLRQRKTNTGNVGLAPWSIRNYLVVLKTALKWAVDQGMLVRVPRFPKVRVPRLRPKPVAQEDYAKLLAAAPTPEWKAYLMCGWWAGLRLGEAKHLRRSESSRWPFVAGNRITLPANFSKSNRDDWVPLHKELAVAIDALPAEGDEVFPNIAALTRRGIGARISKIAKAAGVRLSMHKLRKGFGCRIAKQLGRGDAPVLHRLMRHSSMQLTMDFYASTDDALEDRMRMLT